MDDYTGRIARELKNNPALLRNVMTSPDGQALLRQLERDGGFQRAVQSAARGDTDEMARRLRELMRAPGGAELLERVRKAVEV